jgi:hypothetical protein
MNSAATPTAAPLIQSCRGAQTLMLLISPASTATPANR